MMYKYKNLVVFFMLGMLLSCIPAWAIAPTVRIKDIAHVLEARDNKLMGFGLVVGLLNTGDKTQTGFTQQALTNLVSRMGVVPQSVNFKSRNVAAVIVTADLPPFMKSGQKLDITVSSLGDATSLQGGTLLVTPLRGVDDQVYAVAQGRILVGIDPTAPTIPYVQQRPATVGSIPNGALVEKEVPVSLGERGVLTIVLDQPDFTTISRVEDSIKAAGLDAKAKDAGTITIGLAGDENLIAMVSKIENLTVVPDIIARIVINEQNGTVVIGENVRISPVAVSYAGIDVKIGSINLYSESLASDPGENLLYRAQTRADLDKKEEILKIVDSQATLSGLVSALNAIGASPKDLINILQAIKSAGAIQADLEII